MVIVKSMNATDALIWKNFSSYNNNNMNSPNFLEVVYVKPTSFSLTSHSLRAFSPSLASFESWFSNEDELLFQLQYTPDFDRLGSLTT